MLIRTIYSTKDAHKGLAGLGQFNDFGYAVGIGVGPDGDYGISVLGPEGAGLAVVTRAEMTQILDAIRADLTRTN